ncbi:MAG: hypothetical protein ACTSR3_07800 [Candidatus Helarchaeota archaeon]
MDRVSLKLQRFVQNVELAILFAIVVNHCGNPINVLTVADWKIF